MSSTLRYYGFWRSNAALRIRIALALKGLEAEEIMVDLAAGAQFDPAFLAINPQGAVPAFYDGDGPVMTQSLAILEYLEETHPSPALLPNDPRGRVRVRSLALIAVADAHPLIRPRVRKHLMETYGLTFEQGTAWIMHWLEEGLGAIETRLTLEPETGRFCHGDSVTIADICIVALAIGYEVLGGTVADRFPTLHAIMGRAMVLPAFANAHPLKQPGAPKG